MFPYWSAPPSLLRIWARPDEPLPAIDGRFLLGVSTPKVRAESDSGLGRIGHYVQALFSSPAVDPRLLIR